MTSWRRRRGRRCVEGAAAWGREAIRVCQRLCTTRIRVCRTTRIRVYQCTTCTTRIRPRYGTTHYQHTRMTHGHATPLPKHDEPEKDGKKPNGNRTTPKHCHHHHQLLIIFSSSHHHHIITSSSASSSSSSSSSSHNSLTSHTSHNSHDSHLEGCDERDAAADGIPAAPEPVPRSHLLHRSVDRGPENRRGQCAAARLELGHLGQDRSGRRLQERRHTRLEHARHCGALGVRDVS
eukprot:2421530-Rhodomonas_salina.1